MNQLIQKKTLREIIVESSIIITSFLVFFGFLKQYLYYNFFDIKIQQYLSIDEVFILFLGDLPFIFKILFGIVIYYLLVYFIIKTIIIRIHKNKGDAIEEFEMNIKNEIEEFYNRKSTFLKLMFISIALSGISYYFFYKYHNEFAVIFMSIMLGQFILILIDYLELKIDELSNYIITFIICFFALLYCKNIIDVSETLKNKPVLIKYLEKDKILYYKNYTLIGKTKDFLFLYEKNKKNKKILKSEGIKEITISH